MTVQNDVIKQKIAMVEQEKNELIYQLEQCQGKVKWLIGLDLESENMKYQELVEKFEEQQRMKDEEFEQVKSTIKEKFMENEEVISGLRKHLGDEKDFRY